MSKTETVAKRRRTKKEPRPSKQPKPKSVKADGQMPMVKGAIYSKSTGDQAGTKKGIISGSIKDECEFMMYSFDVKFEGKNVCVQSSTTHANFATQYMSSASNVKLYQTVDDHNIDLAAGRCDTVLSDVASAIDFMATDQGSNAAFTGPTFSGGPWGDGVGGAIRKEDTDILEMWNKAIAEMSADGTTATITEKWFGRDMSM